MANTTFLIYELATGRITWVGECDDSELPTMGGVGLGVLSGTGNPDPNLYYVSGGVKTLRPVMPIKSRVQTLTLTLTGVPYQAVIRILGNALTVITQDSSDGIAEIQVPQAGRYVVRIESYPYRDFIGEFRV